jgi:tetratricopeptide (TPR) repeat protein
VVLGKLGRFEDAIKCSDRALEIDPDFAGAWHNRGLALQGLADAAFARAEELGLKTVDEMIHLTN